MMTHLKRLACNPAFIVAAAFVARMALLGYLAEVAPTPVSAFLPFGYELGRVAGSIASGNGFSSPLRFFDTGPTAWFTPIYPYLVAGIFKVWGIFGPASKLVIQTSNCAFSALTIIPIFAIGVRCFGKAAAVAASWAWVLLPTSLFFPIIWIWDTTLAALVMALLFWATLAICEAKSIFAWMAYAGLWALGVLINPSLLSLFPFLAGWAVWKSRKGPIPWLRISAAMILIFSIAMVPWTVRNYRTFGTFIVLRSNFGLELWLGNNPAVPDTWTPWFHPNDSREEAEKYRSMGEIAYMEEKQHQAIAFIREHPGDTVYFMYRRFVNIWLGITDSPVDEWSSYPWYFRGFVILNVLFSLFTWIGALFASRMKSEYAAPCFMLLVVFPLVFYLTHSSLRYRFPIDPVMAVLAAQGVIGALSLWSERAAAQSGTATPAPPAVAD